MESVKQEEVRKEILHNPYNYLPPWAFLTRKRSSTKTPRFLSAKQKAKKRRATRQAQRHNRKG